MLKLPKSDFCKFQIIDEEGEHCKAFPDEIPTDVYWEPKEKECNNGIKFEKE